MATHGEDDLVVFFNGPQAIVVTVTPAAVEALVNSSNNINKPFIYHFMEPAMGKGLIVSFCDGFVSRICNVAYWWDFIYELSSEGKNHHRVSRILRDYCRQVITARKEELMDKGHVRNSMRSFLDILLQMHMQDGTLTESDILDETVTIIGAGFDTTASAAAFCLYLLGNHLEVQEKLHEELDRVFGDDVDRPVTLDDLRDLPYLDCVIKETLRLYPSVPVVARYIDEDMKIGEQLIPKGTTVTTMIYFLQRHQKLYDDPNSFVPERFQENNGRHQYAFIPFFGGQRNCIGQRFAVLKAKVLVAQVMRRFKIESKLPESELQLEIGIVLRPSQNLDVKLTRRNRTL
ncbi:cytochrome P450 4V2-like [Ixodes scapularis]|uniref:cytochrome P450 4V2-like n=1 Tax=Ixodes scapularis TaxID=6945 RepID=UPI001A9FF870|nr:cytochrome P450 4V2-like [Ixodes scapularis]